MRINPGPIRNWLYTSKFTDRKTHAAVVEFVDGFAEKNRRHGLTGFLVTDGHAIMQLLEGEDPALTSVRDKVIADDRHGDVSTEVWETHQTRAFPNWSMRVSKSSEYEPLFKEIESAKIETIATNIARMLFDTTFAD